MSKYLESASLPPLGAICLDYTDDIHRPPGDPLNPESFDFPLIHEIVPNATLWNVVKPEEYSEEFLESIADSCRRLAERGAIGVITSCGFLAQMQTRIKDRIPIPIATSSLLQIPLLLTMRAANEHIGVITFDAETLGDAHFEGIGIDTNMRKRITIIGCTPSGPLRGIIQRGEPYIHEELEEELLSRAKILLEQDPSITVIVMECTQMPPFSKAVSSATGLPVYDVITMIEWFYSGLKPKSVKPDVFKQEGMRTRQRSQKELAK
ncbi:hypothetical protein HG535_0F06280 [Zygotorulaspora mrakii]|uniref:Aspartate/glutamate racemase family protein n=1 Tax=Zygotorulaspora mrakii TaxID=42260 RepID=A0A7H9B700_ZYGMR|nr:uncharacterized protein HG535_0F06280 [Zygotorulaspora mrakii]QLG74116.1 hypothetical protein HG535_0F06280 [Zygotorulaspora mrakii]